MVAPGLARDAVVDGSGRERRVVDGLAGDVGVERIAPLDGMVGAPAFLRDDRQPARCASRGPYRPSYFLGIYRRYGDGLGGL